MRGHRRLVYSCAVRTGSRVYLLRNWWERVRTHLGLGEPLGLLVLLRHAHRGGLWMWSLVGLRGQRCGLVRCIERGAVDARVFRSAALARFIQSTWLSIFPGKVATGKGRTLLERPATPARRTLATRGATAPAKQMEDISLAFSTLVDDATSNGEGRSLTLAHSRFNQWMTLSTLWRQSGNRGGNKQIQAQTIHRTTGNMVFDE